MRNAWKGPLCNLQTTKAQISLRISAGWSGSSLSAYRISRYCGVCQRIENAPIIRCARSGPTLSANCIRAHFACCASFGVCLKGMDTLSGNGRFIKTVLCTFWKGACSKRMIIMVWGFMSFSTLFKSYRDDGRMIMKGSVQWSAYTEHEVHVSKWYINLIQLERKDVIS